MHENNENTALNALICYHGRALMLAQGWPAHIDVVQCYPGRWPGWISIYARLNAAELVTVLKPFISQTLAPMRYRLEDAIEKLTGSKAELVLYGNRYAQEPMQPGDLMQIAIPFAAQWLTQEELTTVLTCLREAINAVCAQVLADSRRIQAALTSTGQTVFERCTRRFRLVAKESDQPGWLDENDDTLPVVLDAILNKGARFGAIELYLVCESVEHILASGLQEDVLRLPERPPRQWLDWTVLHDVIIEGRREVNSLRDALAGVRAS
ncbi:MAG: hypothetical protein RSD49_09485 [Hafnia sp.]|uniref:hypothetical protein n=1 Tax=Hafnia sp. TaxID=1873498 RepID=UPI002FC8D735